MGPRLGPDDNIHIFALFFEDFAQAAEEKYPDDTDAAHRMQFAETCKALHSLRPYFDALAHGDANIKLLHYPDDAVHNIYIQSPYDLETMSEMIVNAMPKERVGNIPADAEVEILKDTLPDPEVDFADHMKEIKKMQAEMARQARRNHGFSPKA